MDTRYRGRAILEILIATEPQARDCAGAAACTGGGGRRTGAGAVRFLVYARPSGVAFAAPTDSRDRSGAHRHGTVSATGGTDDPQARAQAHLWRAAERRGGSALAGHRAVLVALWSGPVAPAALGGGVGALPQGHARACRLVPVLRCQEADLDETPSVAGHGDRADGRSHRAPIRAPLGHRAAVSQSEALVGYQQPLAAVAHRAGAVDADSLDGLDLGPTAESGGRRCLPDGGGGTLAHEAPAHRRSGGAMAAQ